MTTQNCQTCDFLTWTSCCDRPKCIAGVFETNDSLPKSTERGLEEFFAELCEDCTLYEEIV